ncbi:siderophore-interacting protein [Salinactinospora qingdaonensis]|uniref:Siderophore-interacting protein n=1 Tax=Salinactinospora qingdaonensis TaxID=702744 RepID=A0ABP7F215_9ACTN
MTVTRSEARREMYPLRARNLEVRSTERITPRMIRVIFTGDDLADFRSDNYADHIKLFFPDEETGEHRLPVVDENERWNAKDPGYIFRDYTVRRFDRQARELTVDFVAHDHGPAGRWAMRAVPGQRLGVLGPRGTHYVPHDFDYYVIAADETALPAAARWLEELPRQATVFAFLEVADAAEEQHIDAPAGASITWLHRDGAEPGTTDLLERAVRGLTLPEGEGFVWVAGEASCLKNIRRYLKESGFERGRTADVDGYWRRGTVNLDHHAPPED